MSQVDCTKNYYTCKLFNVKEYPSLVWISKGKVVERFKRDQTINNLKMFINERISIVQGSPSENIEQLSSSLTKDNQVIALNSNNFDLETSSRFTFIHFTVPWSKHCQAVKSEWKKLVKEVAAKDLGIKIAKVDCSLDDALCNEKEVCFEWLLLSLTCFVFYVDWWISNIFSVQWTYTFCWVWRRTKCRRIPRLSHQECYPQNRTLISLCS